MTPERYEEIRALADRLIASFDGGISERDEIESLTQEECAALDTMVFSCACCDQWYDIYEREEDSGGWFVCGDCM